MKPLPMVDLGAQHEALSAKLQAACRRVLDSHRFVLGGEMAALESELETYLNSAHVLTCGSGTDALALAVRALGIGPGDEVIMPSFTFVAPAEAVVLAGATPVFVDIDPETFLIDLNQCRDAITSRTRAVIVVHLFGYPASIEAVEAAVGVDVAVIEDCAQSFGALDHGQATGVRGRFGCFSFFPSKNLGACGDGGALLTQDDELAARVHALRNHGSSQTYHHEAPGLNSRLDELQAALLRVKLPYVEAWNRHRRTAATQYTKQLVADTSVIPPAHHPQHVWHQYTLQSSKRDQIQNALAGEGIDSRVYYPIPVHQQKGYLEFTPGRPLPVTEQLAQQCLSLPMHPYLESADIQRICKVVAHAR